MTPTLMTKYQNDFKDSSSLPFLGNDRQKPVQDSIPGFHKVTQVALFSFPFFCFQGLK